MNDKVKFKQIKLIIKLIVEMERTYIMIKNQMVSKEIN